MLVTLSFKMVVTYVKTDRRCHGIDEAPCLGRDGILAVSGNLIFSVLIERTIRDTVR